MKILKLLAVALLCVALVMTLIACAPEENTDGDSNPTGTTDNNAQTGGEEPGAQEDPKAPVLEDNNDVVVNDNYPDYGQEFDY